ncbi:MAG: transposase [Thermomicrobiales bacterium]
MSDDEDEGAGPPRRRRRSWTLEEKRRIVDESLEDGSSIAEVARRHDLNANQLFTWRRQFGVEPDESHDLAPILPVTIAPEAETDGSIPGSAGQMEIVLAGGDRVLVWDDVDTGALTRVLKALARR